MSAAEIAAIILVSCLSVVVVRWGWKTIDWFWFRPRKLERQLRKQGLKGNRYRFLIGDMKDTARMRSQQREKPIPFDDDNDYFRRVCPFQHQLFDKFGKNAFTWLGPIPMINITEPELIREAMTKMDDFEKPKLNPLARLLVKGLIIHEGEKWAKHRKLINPAFHMEKLKLMAPAFTTCINETINKWEEIVSASGSSEIDVLPYLTSLTADAISRAAFGSSFEEGRHLFKLLKEQIEITIRIFQTIYLPGWKYVPTKNNKRMKELNGQIQNLLKGIIEKRKKAMEVGEPTKDDLLGILMESNSKETHSTDSNKQYRGMSFQDMIDECKLFYIAGQETTSVLIVWAMILLSKHRDWQARARDEVLAKFGKDQPDFDGLNHLKIVTMILYEVLRLYPSVISVTRKIFKRETKLGDLFIPHGAMVNLSFIHAHRDPKLWGDDAFEFNPERFSDGIAKATRGNVSFFPFGWGPRICLGQNFALIEAKMALSMILQRFSFELSPSYTHAPTTMIILQPQYGAHVILHKL